jgi:hypothetical protein
VLLPILTVIAAPAAIHASLGVCSAADDECPPEFSPDAIRAGHDGICSE